VCVSLLSTFFYISSILVQGTRTSDVLDVRPASMRRSCRGCTGTCERPGRPRAPPACRTRPPSGYSCSNRSGGRRGCTRRPCCGRTGTRLQVQQRGDDSGLSLLIKKRARFPVGWTLTEILDMPVTYSRRREPDALSYILFCGINNIINVYIWYMAYTHLRKT